MNRTPSGQAGTLRAKILRCLRDADRAVLVRKWPTKRKLSPAQLARIREALRNGSVMEELALQYGVSVTTIWRIKIGYTYKNAPSDTDTGAQLT